MIWLWISALSMLLTAAIHSIGGEKKLVGPVLKIQSGALAHPQTRLVLRGAWHLTSLFMALTALVMVWPETHWGLKASIAGAWLVVGLYSLISTRGKHIGWPTLTLSGLAGLVGSIM